MTLKIQELSSHYLGGLEPVQNCHLSVKADQFVDVLKTDCAQRTEAKILALIYPAVECRLRKKPA